MKTDREDGPVTRVVAERFPYPVLVSDRGEHGPNVAAAVRGRELRLFPSDEVPHVALVLRRSDLVPKRPLRLTCSQRVEPLLYPDSILFIQSALLQFAIQRYGGLWNERASVRPHA